MTGIFKQKSPANFIVLLFFGLLLKLPGFFNPHIPHVTENDGFLYKELVELLHRTGKMIFPITAWLLLFTNAVILTRIINGNRMVASPNWFPGMSYMLITSLFPEWNYLSPALIVSTIILFVIHQLLSVYNQQDAKGRIYNIGLAVGIASFLFLPSAGFALWVLLALIIMRPFRITEWIVCLLGVATPFYFFAVWLFVCGQWEIQRLIPDVSFGIPEIKQSVWIAGAVSLLLIPFLFGGYYVQDGLRKMLIQVRKAWSLLLLFILFAFFVPFVNGTNSFENWLLAAIPFAAFHASMYLYSSLRIIPLLLFWITVAYIIAFQYGGPRW